MNMHASVITREEALEGALRDMDALLREMQLRAADYLPDGEAQEFISDMLELLDGPEQRRVQGRTQELITGPVA